MFKNGGFYVNYFLSGLRRQYRGALRYSGEYNLLFVTMSLIATDHYMERRVLKELQRVVNTTRTLSAIGHDIERKAEQQKIMSKF